jgi:hypothetical protein
MSQCEICENEQEKAFSTCSKPWLAEYTFFQRRAMERPLAQSVDEVGSDAAWYR